ncbi:MAG: EamA family transporter RarD [Brevibacterium yomogidense]|uniref:Protein rarD n=1 Tax=Brevibacterium yomogidense TaxID=946573 RepID=A0A1X6XHU9_9MICO|nr:MULTISPECIES: EamA family transporter RarD [Brevibacterium]SLM98703.1 Protein rarD [Brevibacterium yomogidense]SMX77097.1 chloramphenicol-sensitive protein RarD [Brevibacterium sp. Mu109]
MTQTPEPSGLPADETARRRAGLVNGTTAYLLWGFLPLYFDSLAPAGSLEILSHRIVWCLLFCALLLALTRGYPLVWRILRSPRTTVTLLAASVLIAINWLGFLLGVELGRVVEVSLGYYINPLITILLGVVFLRERLRPLQWTAVGVAAVAVLVISIGYGSVPWLGLLVAFTFAGYGLLKNRVGATVGALGGLTVETLILTVPAAAFIGWTLAADTDTFTTQGSWHFVFMLLLGPATALPLLLFSAAARRIPLSWVGMLQFITPSMQFVTGVWLLGEEMSPARWAGFAIIWVACALFITDMVRTSRRR